MMPKKKPMAFSPPELEEEPEGLEPPPPPPPEGLGAPAELGMLGVPLDERERHDGVLTLGAVGPVGVRGGESGQPPRAIPRAV